MANWSIFGAQTVLALGKRLAILLAAVAAYSLAAAWLIRRLDLQISDWAGSAGLINTIVLGLLMSFRNRAAYERWWEARTLWGQLVNDSRNLSVKVATFVPADAHGRSDVANALVGFAVALNRQLRGEQIHLWDIRGFEQENDDPPHVPLALVQRLFGVVANWKQAGIVDTAVILSLDPHLRGLLDVCGGCEKIRGTPLSPSYRSLLRAGLVLNVLAGPWLIAQRFGFWGIPAFELMCFFLLGLELIDSEVEEPFGRGRDDLDLDRYCETIRQGVAASLPLS
jgi:putative membrane protein